MASSGPPGRLWNRSFSLLWVGQTISQLGNPAFITGATLWVEKETDSASLMGLLMMAGTLPTLLFLLIGGTFADRHSRVRILIWSDLLSGVSALACAAVLWLRPADQTLMLVVLFGMSVVMGVSRAFFQPAEGAILPDLVPKNRLEAANSLNQLSVEVSKFSGRALGGILYSFFGPLRLFLLDGVSYLFAALCALFIPRDKRAARPSTSPEVRSSRQFLKETADGFRYVWAEKGQRDFLFAVALINFLVVLGLVPLPFYVKLHLKEGPEWFGFLIAGLSAGGGLGLLLAGKLRLTGAARAKGVLTALLLYPVSFGFLVVCKHPLQALATIVLAGMASGLINVYLNTLIQTCTRDELLGRVMAFVRFLTACLTPLSMVGGGLAGELTGKNVPLVIGVCAALALLAVLLLAFRRPCREYLAS